jgi:hypothetical protein
MQISASRLNRGCDEVPGTVVTFDRNDAPYRGSVGGTAPADWHENCVVKHDRRAASDAHGNLAGGQE